LCMAQRFLVERWRGSDLGGQVVSGLLFGTAAGLGMMLAITLAPGLIFDSRTVVLSVASALGGPVVGVTAGLVTAATRLWIGGVGALVGTLSVVLAVLIGVAFHRVYRGRPTAPGVGPFVVLGLITQAMSLAIFALLPVDYEEQILGRLALPYFGTLIPATVALALGLQQVEAFARFDRILEASEDRFRGLVDTAAVAIFEEDLSDVMRRLEELRAAGVTDIRAHAAAHPALLDELLAAIRVVRVNPAGRRVFGAASEADLLSGIDRTFTPAARTVLVDLLAALWERQTTFTAEVPLQTLDGRAVTTILSLPLPADDEAARRVPVSFVDVSEHKAMSSRLAEERQRLSEIIWGTNAGTWEWNVQTGAVVFNERWAEIVGYTLAELEPISIATWERLAHADDLARSEAQLQEVFAGTREYYEIEVRMHHKSGSIVWVLDRGKVTERDAEGRPLRMSGTHTDITDRKTAEEAAARIAAVRELIVRCDGVILRETEEQAMLARLVELLVESRGYAVAWIGVPQKDDERTVKPLVWAGSAVRYIDRLTVHWSDDAAGQGPTGRAIRTGAPQTSNDIARDPTMGFWTTLAEEVGLRSCMAIPVPDRSGVAAVLVVYSDRTGRFGEEEANLLVEFAANLGLAIQTRR
ncbi:PAS domain-containing protein, partial [Stella sp.]|uniref:PAS domain-containing protein n=1 Tax=Stella sp. TaxID=2912054 RepID=UPI0035B22D29